MTWLSIAKFLAPFAAIAALYFWAHDRGWHDRDGDIPALVQSGVDAAVKSERAACEADIKLTGGIADEYRKKTAAADARYADAVGKLYDATHNQPAKPRATVAAGGNNGAASGGRLYYADASGARPALDRALIATHQANQLIGCQAYIAGVTKKGATEATP